MQKCTGGWLMMNWDDMRLFLAVARSGSISDSARQLGVQHSTVSRSHAPDGRKAGCTSARSKNNRL